MCLKKKSPQLDCSIVLSLDYISLSKNGDKEKKKKKGEIERKCRNNISETYSNNVISSPNGEVD